MTKVTSHRLIRVVLPAHLRTLARLPRMEAEVHLKVTLDGIENRGPEADGKVTIAAVLEALEDKYPMLRGTIRMHHQGERRAHMRYFGEGRDLSFEPVDAPLPDSIVSGEEPFIVIGAISGG